MTTWTANCTGCPRENVEVSNRRTHGERVLCDRCAAKPYQMPSATALETPRGKAPNPPPAEESEEPPGVLLADLFDLPRHGLTILGADIFGSGSSAAIEIQLSNGETMTFDKLRDMATPGLLAAELVACTGALPKITKATALRAVALVRTLARQHRTMTDNDAAREWGAAYLQAATVIDFDLEDQSDRWGAFSQLNEVDTIGDPAGVPPPNTILRHIDGTRLVRSSWFGTYVRRMDTVSSREIPNRMSRVGWHRRGSEGRIKASRPGFADTLQWSFYLVAEGWEHDAREPKAPAGNEVTASGLVDARTQNGATSHVEAVTGRYPVTAQVGRATTDASDLATREHDLVDELAVAFNATEIDDVPEKTTVWDLRRSAAS